MGGSINILNKLLEPCQAEEFLQETWGKTPLYIKGRQGKFSKLLTWNRLNEILGEHRLDFPRLRLAKGGKSLSASTYLRHARNVRQRTTIPRLQSSELIKQIRDGATLVLDAVDELSAPVRDLAEALEYLFRERIQVNAYAGWHVEKGFDLHFDDHDVFILQATGHKRWRVYPMTKPYPLPQDRASAEKPVDKPVWEGILQDGDLLYIPRGWWHIAEPLSEATLHLTVGVHNRNGIDLLRWLVEQMQRSAAFRQDLPRFASAEEKRAHIERLRNELLAEWDESLLDSYFDDYDAQAEPRAAVNLPLSVTAETFIPPDDALVKLIAPRPVNFEVQDGVLEFRFNKKLWRFAGEAIVIFRCLENRNVCSVSELCEAARETLDEQKVRAFIGELLFHGLAMVITANYRTWD
jgi:ribosomal protein L16 Arg81 hydroxylase